MSDELKKARELLQAERDARVQACAKEIKAAQENILEKHRCDMTLVPILVPTESGYVIRSTWQVSARED